MKLNPTLFFILCAVVALLISANYFGACSREKPVKKLRKEQTEIQKEYIDNTDLFRQNIDSLNNELEARKELIANLEYTLSIQKNKADRAVIRYRKTPTLQTCDTAIVYLEKQSAKQDSLIGQLKAKGTVQTAKIKAYQEKGLKDSLTISKYDALATKSIGELTQAKKPKRFGIGFHTGVDGLSLIQGQIKPVVSVGLNYSIIRF